MTPEDIINIEEYIDGITPYNELECARLYKLLLASSIRDRSSGIDPDRFSDLRGQLMRFIADNKFKSKGKLKASPYKNISIDDNSDIIRVNNNMILMKKNVPLNEIVGLGELSIDSLEKPTIQFNNEKYYPVYCLIYKEGMVQHRLQRFVHIISSAKRPSSVRIKEHLLNVLNREFNGYDCTDGRYLFRFEALGIGIIKHLIQFCKNGDGTLIDYSWIGPLQDLKFNLQVKNKPRSKSSEVKGLKLEPNTRYRMTKTGFELEAVPDPLE